MKMIRLNSVRMLTMSLVVAGLTLVSCGEDKKKTTDIDEDAAVQTDYEAKDYEASDDNTIKTRQYAMADGDNFTYRYDNDGAITLNNWEDYNTVNLQFSELEDADFAITVEKYETLDYSIANLANTIPAWLKTEEVMEDIADIQKEYKELRAEENASESEVKENLEELSEQFADLREELAETVEDYVKKNKIEFYNDEK